MNETEIAWAAGLFEGEGHIAIQIAPRTVPTERRIVQLALTSTDRDVLEKLRTVLETGHIRVATRPQHSKKQPYAWVASKIEDVERVLVAMLPHLCERRSARANEALAALAHNRTLPDGRCTREAKLRAWETRRSTQRSSSASD